MEFYSNSMPNLIGEQVQKSVYKIMKKKSYDNTISDKITDLMKSFYRNYIQPYKFITLIIVAVVVFLIYRYNNRSNNKLGDLDEQFKNINCSDNIDEIDKDIKDNPELVCQKKGIFDEIINEQTAHLKYDSQPSFNNLESVEKQMQNVTVNYPPNPVPINIPSNDKGLVYTRNIYDDPQQIRHDNLNNPEYNYNNVYEYPQRSYYTGTYNDYNNNDNNPITNGEIMNPLGFPSNFNETTGYFVDGMTNANQQNIVNFQTLLDNKKDNLISAQDVNNQNPYNLEMEPPFATEFY